MHGIILESESVARAGGEATTQESKFDQCRQMLENFAFSQAVIAKVPSSYSGFQKYHFIFFQ